MRFWAEEDKVKVTGRTIYRDNVRYLGYSASSVAFCFTGKKASVRLLSDARGRSPESHAWVAVYLNADPEPIRRLELTREHQTFVIYEGEEEATVTLTIMKYSEPEYGICGIEELEIDSDCLLPPPEKKERKLQIIGDSITCGYGIEGSVEVLEFTTAQENPAKAYSVLAAKALDADLEIVAWNGKGVVSAYIGEDVQEPDQSWLVPMLYQYTDAGCSKEYFRESEEQWEKWDFQRFVPDLVIVFLGTNDASYTRQIPERNREFCDAYQELLSRIQDNYPKAAILCMLGTMDQRLCSTVEQAVGEFSKKKPEARISYLHLPLQADEDGLGTFWHPTPATHQKVAELVTARAREMMNWD